MKTYHLEINDVDDFIPALAEKFDIEYSEHIGEFSLIIPDKVGDGNIRGINFPNGIGLYTYHLTFRENIAMRISHPAIKPIRFIYCTNGELQSSFNDDEEAKNIESHQYLIAAPESNETQNFYFKKDVEVILCYLEIDRLKFQQYFSFDLHELEPIFYKLFSDIKANDRICKTGSISLKTAEIIKEIKNCDLTGFPRINFIGAKSLEILSFMLNRFKKQDQKIQERVLREKDRKAVQAAVDYLDSNIAQSCTVNELAQIAGVNTNKLQEGFQRMYGKTVNEYIRDIRLTKALDMLSSGNKNVSEVVYELGLSSRSYFSKIFKEKYGVSPRKVLAAKELPREKS
ncbi:helix-turn-helix transcriptional regulator [Christiangramia aquimixticola]|uniref:helix-turn-helix transcriptional regulator n=1 Tax=Christiangramia aquimixticola TaxID=1697558 RepID=UPI003AA90FF6